MKENKKYDVTNKVEEAIAMHGVPNGVDEHTWRGQLVVAHTIEAVFNDKEDNSSANDCELSSSSI